MGASLRDRRRPSPRPPAWQSAAAPKRGAIPARCPHSHAHTAMIGRADPDGPAGGRHRHRLPVVLWPFLSAILWAPSSPTRPGRSTSSCARAQPRPCRRRRRHGAGGLRHRRAADRAGRGRGRTTSTQLRTCLLGAVSAGLPARRPGCAPFRRRRDAGRIWDSWAETSPPWASSSSLFRAWLPSSGCRCCSGWPAAC